MTRFKTLIAQAGDRLYNPDHYASKLRESDNGCIEWTGVTNSIGYPFIGIYHLTEKKHKMMSAHRLALIIKLGREIAPGMNANHSCNNRRCMNEQHLFEGTQRQKIKDMVAAGIKGGRQPGVKVGSYNHEQTGREYKYTKEEIQWVRTASLDDIMTKFNTTRKKASAIRHAWRRGYKWLPCPEYTLDKRGRKKIDK